MFNFFSRQKKNPPFKPSEEIKKIQVMGGGKTKEIHQVRKVEDLPKLLQVQIHSKGGTIFNGEADALTASNDVGNFDILPMHSRFVASFTNDVIVHQGKTDRKLELNGGIIRVVDNQVEIFVGI